MVETKAVLHFKFSHCLKLMSSSWKFVWRGYIENRPGPWESPGKHTVHDHSSTRGVLNRAAPVGSLTKPQKLVKTDHIQHFPWLQSKHVKIDSYVHTYSAIVSHEHSRDTEKHLFVVENRIKCTVQSIIELLIDSTEDHSHGKWRKDWTGWGFFFLRDTFVVKLLRSWN